MRVTYRVPRHNSGSVGFRALYSVEDSACGGEITAPSGRFTSPSYPDRYVGSWSVLGELVHRLQGASIHRNSSLPLPFSFYLSTWTLSNI